MKIDYIESIYYKLVYLNFLLPCALQGNDRHRGRIVHLEYRGCADSEGEDTDECNLFLVGKGIVYDTGGSDLKVGGNMASMHRDKCGAAAVIGFFKTLGLLKPKKINVCYL